MAANELAAHASLQPPTVIREPQHVSLLLGGFSPTSGRTAGEQVCIFLTDVDALLSGDKFHFAQEAQRRKIQLSVGGLCSFLP